MKIILSHDVDHITVWEHFTKDLIIPKQLVRTHVELLAGKLTTREYFSRFGDFFRNKWNAVEEVMAFNESRNIKSVFFVGVNNAMGLSYSLEKAEPLIRSLVKRGFEVGVHGISYADEQSVKEEFNTFRSISGLQHFGIRMHYLRSNERTFEYISRAGYTYDATVSGMQDPYEQDGIWEFPLQVMDGWIMQGSSTWQTRNLLQAQQETLRLLEEAKNKGLKYVSILFHDRYFSGSFVTWRDWYSWLVDHLKNEGCEFVTYSQAVAELNSSRS